MRFYIGLYLATVFKLKLEKYTLLNLIELRNLLERKRGVHDRILNDIAEIKERISGNQQKLDRHEEAREVVRTVALKIQQQLQFQISSVTSLALNTVYDEPYELIIEFIQRRNKTECDLYFMRDDNRYDPIDDSGGGVVNVASFALRVASWHMQQPRSRNVLILDEPFGQVSVDLLPRVSEMIRQISKSLKLQLIMITHANELIESADRSFYVYKQNGISHVKEQR
jgi:DNA repair exonuclease SbcCD ATPase subunit